MTPYTHYTRRYVPSTQGKWGIASTESKQRFVSDHSPSWWRARATLNATVEAPQWLIDTLPEWVAPEASVVSEVGYIGTLLWSIAGQACALWTSRSETERESTIKAAQNSLVTLESAHQFLKEEPQEELTRACTVIQTCIYSNMVGIDDKDEKPVLPGVAVNIEFSSGGGSFHYDPDFYGSSWDGESLGAVLAKSAENERIGGGRLSAILPASKSGGFTAVGLIATEAWALGIEELANRTFRLSSTHSV